jgi:phage FluMu protein Com
MKLLVTEASEASGEEMRCECGRLMARVMKDRIVLKCPRCKRIVALVRVNQAASGREPRAHFRPAPSHTREGGQGDDSCRLSNPYSEHRINKATTDPMEPRLGGSADD